MQGGWVRGGKPLRSIKVRGDEETQGFYITVETRRPRLENKTAKGSPSLRPRDPNRKVHRLFISSVSSTVTGPPKLFRENSYSPIHWVICTLMSNCCNARHCLYPKTL